MAFSRVSVVSVDYGQHISKKELSTSNGMDLNAMNWENIMIQGFLSFLFLHSVPNFFLRVVLFEYA